MVLLGGCHKADPVQSAQGFFQLLFDGKAKAAYDGAAFGFQTMQTQSSFEANAREMGLTGGKEVEFDKLEVNGRTAKLPAKVTTSRGDKLTLVVTLEDERGTWRVYSIKTPKSVETGLSENRFSMVGKGAGFNDATRQPMPDQKIVLRMVKDNLLEFNRAIRARSFTDFYNSVSASWQSQLTEKQLQRAFQSFIDQDVNIGSIADLEPVLSSPPQIGSDGVLVVTGYYPTSPYVVNFSLKFLYELPDWKLFGLDVDLRKP